MKYIVWFSGWIDSCYAGFYLKNLWHEVILINLRNTRDKNKCCKLPTELFDVAKSIGLPLEVHDVTDDFQKYIIDDFVRQYKSGLTPNPCINCNEKVRWIALEKIRQEKWFDKISSGHYANLINLEWQNFLTTPADGWKDQTYMLYRISNVHNAAWERVLNYVEFPLSAFEKTFVKEEVKKNNILVSTDEESQNICFVPDDDYKNFIKSKGWIYPSWDIIHNWKKIWTHQWIIGATIGQRRGLSLPEWLFVTKIDVKNNCIIVWEEKDLFHKEINVFDFFLHDYEKYWISELFWRIRYRASFEKIENIEIWEKITKISFESAQRAPTAGQHTVIYGKLGEKLVVLWWGIIL